MHRLLAGLIFIAVYSSCSSGRYLQRCQTDAVESLGKGMALVGNKIPQAYERVNKYLGDDRIMSNLTTEIANDSNYDKTFIIIDSLADDFAKNNASKQELLNAYKAGWILCIKITELLKAISNPDFFKTFETNKDNLSSNVDSLISKYNYAATNKINQDYGRFFSAIALQIGKHKIKRKQQQYFLESIEASGTVLKTILQAIRTIQLQGYTTDINSVKSSYFNTYAAWQRLLSENKMKPELAFKIFTELESVRKELLYLENIERNLDSFCLKQQELITELSASLKNEKVDCKKLNSIITDLDVLYNQLEINSSFLK